MVESTWFVWEDLGSSPMYANYVLLFYYWFFYNMYEYRIGIVRLIRLETLQVSPKRLHLA